MNKRTIELPMYRKDYVLRLIEMIAEMVAGILGLIKKGKLELAKEEVQKAYSDVLELDADKLAFLSAEDLIHFIRHEQKLNSDYLKMISDLCFVQAELLLAQGNRSEASEYYKKSIALLEVYLTESKLFSFSNQKRIQSINARISELTQ